MATTLETNSTDLLTDPFIEYIEQLRDGLKKEALLKASPRQVSNSCNLESENKILTSQLMISSDYFDEMRQMNDAVSVSEEERTSNLREQEIAALKQAIRQKKQLKLRFVDDKLEDNLLRYKTKVSMGSLSDMRRDIETRIDALATPFNSTAVLAAETLNEKKPISIARRKFEDDVRAWQVKEMHECLVKFKAQPVPESSRSKGPRKEQKASTKSVTQESFAHFKASPIPAGLLDDVPIRNHSVVITKHTHVPNWVHNLSVKNAAKKCRCPDPNINLTFRPAITGHVPDFAKLHDGLKVYTVPDRTKNVTTDPQVVKRVSKPVHKIVEIKETRSSMLKKQAARQLTNAANLKETEVIEDTLSHEREAQLKKKISKALRVAVSSREEALATKLALFKQRNLNLVYSYSNSSIEQLSMKRAYQHQLQDLDLKLDQRPCIFERETDDNDASISNTE